MKFEQTPGVNKNPKWKYYTKIGLLALISLLSRGELKAQSGPQKSTPTPKPTAGVDVGKGTYKDPWKYKLPKAEEDPIVAEVNRTNRDPERAKKALEEMIATVTKKRAEGRKNVTVDKLKEYDSETALLLFELRTGQGPVDEEYETKTGYYAGRKDDKGGQ
ncbi:MAG: hypothetical protein ACK4FA_00155 [Candidatus Paceibacteria bacterium]